MQPDRQWKRREWFLSAAARNKRQTKKQRSGAASLCGGLARPMRSGGKQERETGVTPWWLGKWPARCSPPCTESWWPVAFWSSVWRCSERRAQSACLTPPTVKEKWVRWTLEATASIAFTLKGSEAFWWNGGLYNTIRDLTRLGRFSSRV